MSEKDLANNAFMLNYAAIAFVFICVYMCFTAYKKQGSPAVQINSKIMNAIFLVISFITLVIDVITAFMSVGADTKIFILNYLIILAACTAAAYKVIYLLSLKKKSVKFYPQFLLYCLTAPVANHLLAYYYNTAHEYDTVMTFAMFTIIIMIFCLLFSFFIVYNGKKPKGSL